MISNLRRGQHRRDCINNPRASGGPRPPFTSNIARKEKVLGAKEKGNTHRFNLGECYFSDVLLINSLLWNKYMYIGENNVPPKEQL